MDEGSQRINDLPSEDRPREKMERLGPGALSAEELLAIFEKDAVLGFKIMDYLLGAVGKQFEQLQDEIARVKGIEMMSHW
jgi:DNA repair protein RadC